MLPRFPEYASVLDEGFTEESNYGVLRTEMDNGMAKQRARWSKAVIKRTVQVFVKNNSEKTQFDHWVRDELHGGAGWFEYDDPISQNRCKARIVNGVVNWSTPGVAWKGQCQMEIIH